MTITPAGDGKTLKSTLMTVSHKTKGANDVISKIGAILKNKSVTGWDEMQAGQDTIVRCSLV